LTILLEFLKVVVVVVFSQSRSISPVIVMSLYLLYLSSTQNVLLPKKVVLKSEDPVPILGTNA